jgi:CBS domain-containing protein
MSIKEVLQHKGHHVVTIRPTATILAAVQEFSKHRIGAVVVESAWMRPIGIFSERDFVNAVAEHGASALAMSVESLMTAPIVSCRPSDKVETAMSTMTLAKIRHLPVVEGDELLGIVSIGDLVKHRLDEKMLEAGELLDLTRMRA